MVHNNHSLWRKADSDGMIRRMRPKTRILLMQHFLDASHRFLGSTYATKFAFPVDVMKSTSEFGELLT